MAIRGTTREQLLDHENGCPGNSYFIGSREERSGKPRMKKKVSGSSTERNGPSIFIPISVCAGTRPGAEYLQELRAPALKEEEIQESIRRLGEIL